MRPPRRSAALLAALLLAGCRPEDPRAAEPAGGTLVIAAPGDADVLLPPILATQVAAHVSQLIFSRLAEPSMSLNTVGDSGFEMVLADRFERRDSVTLAFHVHERARWQDGRPITADDVVFTYDLHVDTTTGSQFGINLEPLASVTAEGDRTVVFRFKRRYPEQFYDATYHLQIMPRHVYDTIPRDRLESSNLARDPVGAGPFRFERWDAGAEIEIVADTTWFLGRPRLNRVLWRIMPDVSSGVNALLAGEADAMETIPQPDELERARRSAELRALPYATPIMGGVLFNTRRPPFDDRGLRRALAMAIDRATTVRSVLGEFGDVPTSALTEISWAARGSLPQLPYDTAAAARLLDSLGWRLPAGGRVRQKNGRPLRFTVLAPSTSRLRQQAAVLLQNQWARVGATADIRALEFAVFDERQRAGNFEVVMFSRTLDPSPRNLAQFWASRSLDNQSGYQSAAFDSLLEDAGRSPTPALAMPLYHEALALLNQDAPGVFLYSPRNNAIVHRRFEHVTIRPDYWLATVPTWSVAPDQRLPRDQ